MYVYYVRVLCTCIMQVLFMIYLCMYDYVRTNVCIHDGMNVWLDDSIYRICM